MSDLKRLIAQGPGQGLCHEPRSRPDLTVMALTWPAGLRCLVAANFPVANALIAALALEDMEPLSILLETPRPIFSASCEKAANQAPLLAAHVYRREDFEPKAGMILAEFVRRRNSLKRLAVRCLSSHQQAELGINDHDILDANAEATYRSLEQVTTVSESLDCCRSPYHVISGPCQWSTKDLDRFYDAGFKAVDLPDRNGLTPLLWAAAAFRNSQDVVLWFLVRGARPEWDGIPDVRGMRYPNIVFYLALSYRFHRTLHSFHTGAYFASWNQVRDWVPLHLHTVSDGCTCACGTDGCLAIHLLWRCNHSRCWCLFDGLTDRMERLKYWILHWRLPGGQKELLYSEAARPELFERLGMVHTCCCNSQDTTSWEIYPRICPDPEEIAHFAGG